MKHYKLWLSSAVGSVIITFITGQINSTPGSLVGASWFGFPVTWIRKLVIAPQYNPWVIDWVGLLIDLIFWFVLFSIILYALRNIFWKEKKSSSKGRKN